MNWTESIIIWDNWLWQQGLIPKIICSRVWEWQMFLFSLDWHNKKHLVSRPIQFNFRFVQSNLGTSSWEIKFSKMLITSRLFMILYYADRKPGLAAQWFFFCFSYHTLPSLINRYSNAKKYEFNKFNKNIFVHSFIGLCIVQSLTPTECLLHRGVINVVCTIVKVTCFNRCFCVLGVVSG